MPTSHEYTLTSQQLGQLGAAFQQGAANASTALHRWLERPSIITIDAVEQLPLTEATAVLGAEDATMCCCVAEIHGRLSGELVLAFDDASGLALADLLLNQPTGTATAWNEMEVSAAVETANIAGCAYLNALAESLPALDKGTAQLIPSPPRFHRDFAECLLQSAFMPQACTANQIFLAKSLFQIEESSVRCTLLWIPDAASVQALRRWLPDGSGVA